MPKRSAPDEQRLMQLGQANACYLITCFEDEFQCKGHPEGYCGRGFFSLFIQAIYGMAFAKQYGLPYLVDFSNLRYAYSGKAGTDPANFWNHLMVQEAASADQLCIPNQRYETHPLRIWNRSFLRSLHRILCSELRFQRTLQEQVDSIRARFRPFRLLGVHVRRTDHYTEMPPARAAVYLKKIRQRIHAFDRLFVATDDAVFLKTLQGLYPEKVLAHDFHRSSTKQAVHDHRGQQDGLVLAEEAILDCVSISCCQELILSPSNLSYAALIFQPELPYTLVESRKAAWSRRKTLLVYLLNRWGLRKW